MFDIALRLGILLFPRPSVRSVDMLFSCVVFCGAYRNLARLEIFFRQVETSKEGWMMIDLVHNSSIIHIY